MWLFYYLYFERNYNVLKSKSLCFLLKQNINFHKNETESKMENLRYGFREMNFVLQLESEWQIKKSKTVMRCSSRKKKGRVFDNVCFARKNVFSICILLQFIVYWINFQNIYAFTYQKVLLHKLFLRVFKIVESLK